MRHSIPRNSCSHILLFMDGAYECFMGGAVWLEDKPVSSGRGIVEISWVLVPCIPQNLTLIS